MHYMNLGVMIDRENILDGSVNKMQCLVILIRRMDYTKEKYRLMLADKSTIIK